MNWTDIYPMIAVVAMFGAVIGANYKFTQNMRNDLKTDMLEHKEEMEKIDKRWIVLFEKFHIFDKDMEKFRTRREINKKNEN